MTDPTSALLHTLRRGVNFVNFTPERLRSRSWASATFTGVRHEISFRLEGEGANEAADAFLEGLEEREFDLRGHILADIAMVSETRMSGPEGPLIRIALEALTIEDC